MVIILYHAAHDGRKAFRESQRGRPAFRRAIGLADLEYLAMRTIILLTS